MRRRPTSNGGGNNGGGYNNNNNQRRQRYQSGGGGSQGGGNRPRKNYGAMREKYLGQARDALASGDRVLAENYFQHADHCYRMLVEEGIHNPRPQHVSQPRQEQGQEDAQAPQESFDVSGNGAPAQADDVPPASVLPAFLTVPFGGSAQPAPEPQNWEDRDA